MKLLALTALAAAGLAAPAAAQTGPDDVRVNQLITYGDDPCPQSTETEIVICVRRPNDDRYRIPENLRDNPNARVNQPWPQRAEELTYMGRTGIGSCSTAGSGGATGCLTQLINQARAERANSDNVNWARLIEEARQERLSRIDAEAAAVQAEIDAKDD
jgi:hypothetical protein